MSTATLDPPVQVKLSSTFSQRLKGDPAYQAFLLLRVAFTVAPIVFGLDKFFNILVDWEGYLAPWINDIVPGSASTAMHLVGIVEIVAGLAVALKPRYGAYLVAAWLGGIIIDLLTYSRLLRHRPARLRPDARRPHPGPTGKQVRPAGAEREALNALTERSHVLAALEPFIDRALAGGA